MILHPPATATRQLSYDPKLNQYVGEVSDTNGFGRVYDDACDIGMTLVNLRTGREVVFSVDREDYRDGELVSWTLVPAGRVAGLLRDCTVLLFND